jgi:hypothetical protein
MVQARDGGLLPAGPRLGAGLLHVGSQVPSPDIGAWNLLIGGGLAFIGLIMATRWR